MSRLTSIVDYRNWPPSPSAGRPSTDPRYKLRLQAELNALEGLASKPVTAPKKRSLGGNGKTRTVRNGTTIRRVSQAGASTALRPRQRRVVPSWALPSSLTVPKSPSPPVAPPSPPVDSIVVLEQGENEAWLAVTAPRAAIELKLARERIGEAFKVGGYEQSALLAQALESLRRALGKLADAVCPPRPGPTQDRLGKDCPTHERAHKARINLALQEATDSKGRYRLSDREVGLHHQRLTQMIDRIAEGIHGEGDFEEARQLYVGGWQIVATCRLHLPLERFSSV